MGREARRVSTRVAFALIFVFSVVGCGGGGATRTGHITAVEVTNETCFGTVCGVARTDPANIVVRGDGVCSFQLFLGNGTDPTAVDNYDFSSGAKTFQLKFDGGWPGPKTIVALGGANCPDRVTTPHHVFTHAGDPSEIWAVGMNTPTDYCYEVPASPRFPALRPATRVHITAPTTPKVVFAHGQQWDPDGIPGSSAPASFFFPGLREYSLVAVLGIERHQAGTNATFTTVKSGHLMLCVNDDNPSDNGGGWSVNILVDESQAP